MRRQFINIFLPQSGNLGDTCNILPVLSGLYKHTGEKINLLVRDKMSSFKGIKKLFEAQECIESFRFESKPRQDTVYHSVFLENEYTKSLNRPWESCRYEEFLRNRLNLNFKVDDEFELNVPEIHVWTSDFVYIVGDRTYSKDADTRRAFDVLKNSEKFPEEKSFFLDYKDDLIWNLNCIKGNINPFITTFTGIAVLADLMKKETMVVYPEELSFWDNKPVQYSFNQHFYRDRNCELVALTDM